MKKLIKISCIVASSALFFVGCGKKKEPAPLDTVVGTSSGTREGGMGETDAYSESLSERGGALSPDPVTGKYYNQEDVISAVYYDFDQYAITAPHREMLKGVVEKLKAEPEHRILVAGHCDWHGTAEYNLGLGERRAKGVVNYLVQMGIDRSRFEVLSRGDIEAIRGTSVLDGAKDRRSDIVWLKK
ncbi:MAG: hypothetical protein A2007_05485 [Verrucomicrobia bacterium GWC2_42_7]|nr:MAG: hypothetical protein A2007_05485 [Verrucomicrobia bacterium GWC2_42_7]